MLSALFEIVFQFIFEIILETVVEFVAELGFGALAKGMESKTIAPILGTVFYAVVGTILGLLSAIAFPVIVVENVVVRLGLMVVSSITMGLMLCLISWFIYRKDRNEPFWVTAKFVTGFVFGASYSLSRGYFVGSF